MAIPSLEDVQTKSKRPSGSAFKQQKLSAWQPILTAGTVLPTFFIIGLAFIPIGVGLYVSSSEVQEFVIDYTSCKNSHGVKCEDILNATSPPLRPCICELPVNLTEFFKADVYMYYGLTNFYQNHRRYVKSRDDRQLIGEFSGEVSGDCEPFNYFQNTSSKKDRKPYLPCGAIANSLFNDTLILQYRDPGDAIFKRVKVFNTGIAWPTDKSVKFKNPKNITYAKLNSAKPMNWPKSVFELDPNNDTNNNGLENEDLIVWMRTAALPTFRKLYRRINHSDAAFRDGLPNDKEYKLIIHYNYPVHQFKGTKRMILSNTSWLGGKNPFLGIAYIVVGCICLILAIMFLVIHIKFGKSTHDLVTITQRTPY